MENREKFTEEILDIACQGGRIAVDKNGNVVNCNIFRCTDCEFYQNFTCNRKSLVGVWSKAEYVEKHTITPKEKMFLNLICEEYKYIVRNHDGLLLAYKEKPIKISKCWGCSNYGFIGDIFDINFNFIKQEDKKPWLIKDLLKLEVKE